MRAFLLAGGLAATLALTPAASAHRRTLAPPGNSGVSQYVETLPTSGGGQPTSTVHPRGNSGQNGAISPQTAKVLARSGPAGASAAALAQATAPPGVQGRSVGASSSTRARRGRHSSAAGAVGGVGGGGGGGSGGGGGGGASPLGSVVKALTNSGSGGGGGLGPALPAILIACALAAVGILVIRLRRRAG